jgi:membrane-associated phospholipid phosphatase
MHFKTVLQKALPVLLFLLCFTSLSAQNTNSPAVDSVIKPQEPVKHIYRMNYWVTGTFNVLATAGNFYAIPNILHAKKPLTDLELSHLDRSLVNGIDRLAFKQDPAKREKFYKISDVFLPTMMIGAFSLGFDKKIRKDGFRVFMMYYELQAATFSMYNFSFFGPAFQNRIRPVAYYPEAPIDRRKSGGARNSMFSGHTANATAATFFMAKVYSDYHPELGKKKYLLFAAASIPPLVQGYLRIKALAHFPSDVLVGYTIGAVAGIAVPALHRYRNRNINIGLAAIPNGAGLRMQWKFSQKEKQLLNSFNTEGDSFSVDK